LDAYKQKLVKKIGLGAVLVTAFAGTGWLFLSTFEGWMGVLLWVMLAIPICFLLEFLLRPRAAHHRSPRSLPRMRVRAPVRGDPERLQPSTRSVKDPDFNWRREEQKTERRRRSYVQR